MRLDWANVSGDELSWSVPALIAFSITVVMLVWAWRSFRAIRRGIRQEPARYRRWGRRWNFGLLLMGAMACFGIGWLGWVGVGVLAMLTPPPITEANQAASGWFARIFIGMEMSHALGQVLLWAALRSLAGEPVFPRLGA